MSKSCSLGILSVSLAFVLCALALIASGQSGWQTLVFVESEVDGGTGGVDGLDGAEFVTVSPDGRHVYVAAVLEDAVAVFSRSSVTGGLDFVEAETGVDGLVAPVSIAVSPDDKHVYVAAVDAMAVVVFSRDSSTGALTWIEAEKEGFGSVVGLNGAWAVAVSPDGNHVYAAGNGSDAVVVFARNAGTGALTFKASVKDGDPGGVDGIDGPRSLAVSPDGDHVYVASSGDSAVAVLSRSSSTGLLSFVEAVKDSDAGVDGLDSAWSVALSPDGGYVYVAGQGDDAVAVFSRNPATGMLSFEEALFDDLNGVDGLAGAHGVAVSPDGQHLYAAGRSDDAVAVFDRNPTTGQLAWSELVRDGVGGVDGLASARSVAVTPDGDHVYAAGSSDDAVAVFESWGPAPQEEAPPFVMTWGSTGSGPGQFKSPFGATTGSLYVADTQNHRIQKFDASGNFLSEWGSQGSANGSFDIPGDVTADTIGQVFVLDTGNDRVQVFDGAGSYLRQWGANGNGPGQLANPRSIAVGAASVTYVADTGNHRIQRFAPTGLVLAEWGSSGTGPGQFVIAAGVAVGPSEDIYVSDYSLTALHHRIQRFDSSGNLLASWGAGPSSHNGRLSSPGHMAVDQEGNVYVPDSQNNRIQKFDRDGNFLIAWGTYGSGDGQFDSPSAVAVDSIGRIYVVDRGNNRIQVFAGPWLDAFIAEAVVPAQVLWPSPTLLREVVR